MGVKTLILKNKWIDRRKSSKQHWACGRHCLRVWFTIIVIFIIIIFCFPKSFRFFQFLMLRLFSVFKPDLPFRPQDWAIPLALNFAPQLDLSVISRLVSPLLRKQLAWSSPVRDAKPLAPHPRISTIYSPVAHGQMGTFWAPKRALFLIITWAMMMIKTKTPFLRALVVGRSRNIWWALLNSRHCGNMRDVWQPYT